MDEKDPTTGRLPTQAHGTLSGGKSGEAQVLKRYALATFFFATSKQEPWSEQWNFLSEKVHECAWHQNKTRQNFHFGDFDPVGFVCREYQGSPILLDDTKMEIGEMLFNIRSGYSFSSL